MFGRRTSESFPATSPKPNDEQIDLDILADLPDLPVAADQLDAVPPAREQTSSFQHAWQTEQAPDVAYEPNIPEPPPFVPASPDTVPFTDAPTAASSARSKSTAESVIGPDDFFDGNYRSERGVRLQGTVRGSIESRQYIFVESGARVEANLSAEDITISGDFNGTIECRHRLEITASGTVHGQVTTAMLVVQEGGLLDGELHMRREDA